MFLVLIAAITKGALQLLSSSSYWGAAPVGCSGPVKPSVNAKGLVSTLMMAGLACADAMVARIEAIVPPEKVPFIARTLPLTVAMGFPV